MATVKLTLPLCMPCFEFTLFFTCREDPKSQNYRVYSSQHRRLSISAFSPRCSDLMYKKKHIHLQAHIIRVDPIVCPAPSTHSLRPLCDAMLNIWKYFLCPCLQKTHPNTYQHFIRSGVCQSSSVLIWFGDRRARRHYFLPFASFFPRFS